MMAIENDVIIVGAGFSGMYLLKRLREQGFCVRVIEAGDDVGGTWYWNRYPGARCDVESLQYGFSFDEDLQREWSWSERYAAQPEILSYASHVAERFDLRKDISFNTRVTKARFSEQESCWEIVTDQGTTEKTTYLVLATGCLSVPNDPKIKGLENFHGPVYHTGRWPKEKVDFHGKKVGVIGTGSSAIQSIPLIAEEAEQLYVFQRTPNYAVPAQNKPMDKAVEAEVKSNYKTLRDSARSGFSGIYIPFAQDESAKAMSPEERRKKFQERWDYGGLTFMMSFKDLLLDDESNAAAREFVQEKIADIVDDPETAKLLTPNTVIGCKRLCVDTGYFQTYNKPHVHLVDIAQSGIDEITTHGVKAGGKEYQIDSLVLATGFDAMTGAIKKIHIEGPEGTTIQEKWSEGPKSYLGISVAGFPNMFMVTGPGSPSVLTNMIMAIEHHVDWITQCLVDLRDRGMARIEPEVSAEENWVAHNREVADSNLRSTCSSWYVGANIPGKPRVFMPYIGGFPAYVEHCKTIQASGYDGFSIS